MERLDGRGGRGNESRRRMPEDRSQASPVCSTLNRSQGEVALCCVMAPAQDDIRILAVIAFPDGWRVLPEARGSQIFASREAALAGALDLLQLEAASEREVELLVQEPFGELRRLGQTASPARAVSPPERPGARQRPAVPPGERRTRSDGSRPRLDRAPGPRVLPSSPAARQQDPLTIGARTLGTPLLLSVFLAVGSAGCNRDGADADARAAAARPETLTGAVGTVSQENAGAAVNPVTPTGDSGGPAGQTPAYGEPGGAPAMVRP